MIEKPTPPPVPDFIAQMLRSFPTSEDELLPQNSYFNYVLYYLQRIKRGKFLEIGYRKGVFVEVCKLLKVPSVHLDVTDKLLRASPTENNICLLKDSLEYLKYNRDIFQLIFQDGSKSFHHRWGECKLIRENDLLDSESYMISDDLHYRDCRRAFDKAISELQYEGIVIEVRGSKKKKRHKHKIGILKIGS